MKNHTDLLNYLAREIKAGSYLEIGVSNKANNFDKINVAYKIGVDPDPGANAEYQCTSDKFFLLNEYGVDEIAKKPFIDTFDLIFIDGLHHADQVQRDFENSLKILNKGGLIVLHDTNPEAEYLTHVPRDKKGRWLGDVYKFACNLDSYEGVDFRTVDFDNGCTVVWKSQERWGGYSSEISWDYFNTHRQLLKLIKPAAFQPLFESEVVADLQ